jgi:ribosomal protein L12E/L44/L45/RPP1/RPP2
MAKELPYFKFFPSEWVTGDITLCDEKTQGVFITICAFYWMKDCSMSLANAKQRFSKNIASLDYLLEQKIIKVDDEQNIVINFLDKQMNEFIDVAEKRAIAGSKGGLAKAKQLPKIAKAKRSNKDKEEDKDKEKIVSENLKKFNLWLENNAPMVLKMKIQMTSENLVKIKEKYSIQQIQDIMLKMHNYKPLLTKNNDVYLTALNWLAKDKKEEPKTNGTVLKTIDGHIQP